MSVSIYMLLKTLKKIRKDIRTDLILKNQFVRILDDAFNNYRHDKAVKKNFPDLTQQSTKGSLLTIHTCHMTS